MVDKLLTVPIQALGEVVGPLEPDGLTDLDLALRGWLSIPFFLSLPPYGIVN